MKVGYPCINTTIGCKSSSTFRLKSYSEERLITTVSNNLNCLFQILKFNVAHNLLFFRISSATIPFASHSICQFNWQAYFKDQLKELGRYIKKNQIRISMHPDQFVLINALDEVIVRRSIQEITWHVQFLDLLDINDTAKIQIHVGGIYNNKNEAMKRFISQYHLLSDRIKSRLVIENDDRLYSIEDCVLIHQETGMPIIFDNLHFKCLSESNDFERSFMLALHTWKKKDGVMMVDYSAQDPNGRKGKHAQTIDEQDFISFLKATRNYEFDVMLEIKDKERSALRAVKYAASLLF